METRRLGRTGHESSVLIFGGAALWDESPQAALDAITLVRAHGVNHFDVAPQYGKSEELVGPWLAEHREEVFLGCKTMERTRQGAWEELQRSLKVLKVDQIDLYQFHAVGDRDRLDQVLGPGGAVEAFLDARDRGLIRYIGITGHGYTTLNVHREALERFDFDTVMTPLNFIQAADPQFRADFNRLATLVTEKDVGLMIIKTFTKSPWGERPRTFNTWYEPFDTPQEVQSAANFVLSQPVTGITTPGDLRLLPMVLAAAENFRRLDEEEQTTLVSSTKEAVPLFDAGWHE